MMNKTEEMISPLQQGVKLIGIGKHGSKKLPDELIAEINEELKGGKSSPILIGAFFGALMMKEIQASYLLLEEFIGKGSLNDAASLWENCCEDAPKSLKPIGIKLINKETLNLEEATALGNFLFSDLPGESFRGMAVSILRIRYESEPEYEGLYTAITQLKDNNRIEVPAIQYGIQLAEPFDGVEHSYMITPLIASELQKEGHAVVVSCGRSSGPKITLNTWDLYKGLDADFVDPSVGIKKTQAGIGFAFDQKVVYPKLEEWVDRRRIIMKRPFLSTLEKVLNPLNATVLICSVFHIPYLEKMATLGHMAGFEGVIVLKRGLEGSLAASLSKATGVFCSFKKEDGSLVTTSFDGSQEPFSKFRMEVDSTIEDLSLQANISLVNKYLKNGKTGNEEFDNRVKLSTALYKKGLEWINKEKARQVNG